MGALISSSNRTDNDNNNRRINRILPQISTIYYYHGNRTATLEHSTQDQINQVGVAIELTTITNVVYIFAVFGKLIIEDLR